MVRTKLWAIVNMIQPTPSVEVRINLKEKDTFQRQIMGKSRFEYFWPKMELHDNALAKVVRFSVP